LRRPSHLASNNSVIIEVIRHVLRHIKADIIVLLNPTSPIRINNIIDHAIKRFIKNADSLATGYLCKHYEWGTIHDIPRQKKKGFFVANGFVYIHKTEILLDGKWYGKKLERMIVPQMYNFDIDEDENLWAVEGIIINLKKGGIIK